MRCGWLALLAMVLVATVEAEPALQVSGVDGKIVVRAQAPRMAAWRPVADGLVVVVPAGGEVAIGALPRGVTAQKISGNGLQGLVVRGQDTSWKVVQDGTNWLVRPGNGLKSQSVLMMRDGWYTDGETLKPQAFEAFGKQWQVALVGRPLSVVGSVVGGVRLMPTGSESDVEAIRPAAGGADDMVATAPAAPMPAPGERDSPKPEMQVVKTSDMMARGGEEQETAEPGLPDMPAKPQPVAADVAEKSGLAKVAVHPAPSMKPLAVNDVQSEILPRVLGDVYMPGTLVSLTLPDGMTGLGVPLPALEKKSDEEAGGDKGGTESHAVAESEGHGKTEGEAHGQAPHGAPAEHVGPQADLHTVVAGDVTGKEAAQIAVSDTGVRGSWNQITLEPARQAMEAEKQKQADDAKAREGMLESPPKPDMAAVEEAHEAPEEDTVRGLLPSRGKRYVEDVEPALRAVAEAPENSVREREAQMYLAGLYLQWHRPEDTMAVLGGLPVREDKLPASPTARLLMGVAKLARGVEVEPKLFDQGGELAPHSRLWRAVAASRNGDYATALKLWPQERGVLPQYPAYLREMAQEAQVTALVLGGERTAAKAVLDELVEGYKDEADVPAALNRLRGLVRLGTPEESEGLEYLAKAAEDVRDPVTAYRAKFEFVRALYQRRDLSDEQVRAYLTDLWFDWRGDKLEQDVLFMLGELYEKGGDSRQALQYWQTLVRAFPRADNLKQVTERMGEAFVHVFDPENPHTYSPLEYVGLYYDFSELVPNNARGDLIHEQVSRLLINANLWERAVPILEQQLKFRPLDAATQGRLSLMLADAYGHMGKAAEGIKIIDKWKHAATTQVLAREWKLVEADLLLRLKRPQAVLKALATMPDDDAEIRDLRIEAAWMAKDWPRAISLLEDRLKGVTPADLASNNGAQVAAFRLGYAYGQTRNAEKLDALETRYGSVMNRMPQLADGLGAVAAGTGISASITSQGPLAPLTTALSDANRLADRIQIRREELAKQRDAQQEYNDKMKYMELLPPPAI